jgi:selenocysteine lyase/cysteine desulfurase
VGTLTPVAEVAALAHEAGALAWVDAVHYAPHGPIDVQAAGADVLLCSPYKFYGPHLGIAYLRREVAEGWRPYKVRPAPDEPFAQRFETGTLAFELLAGFVAAVDYLADVGWDFIHEHEGRLGQQFLDGLPEAWRLYGAPTMANRVPTFAIGSDSLAPNAAAEALGERGFAVWDGNYYAVEIMRRLGLDEGALRIGIVHYNTAAEVERLLEALAEISEL